MRTLLRTLQDLDLGHLRIVSEVWGLPLDESSPETALNRLTGHILQPENLEEMIESLAEQSQHALHTLISRGGRHPFASFNHKYGPLREMGPGKRDRLKPWRQPCSAVEELWYAGLVGRAFLDTPEGIDEFIFLPTDLLNLLPPAQPEPASPPGSETTPPRQITRARSMLVDDAATLLAAGRLDPLPSLLNLEPEHLPNWQSFLHLPEAAPLLLHLLVETRILQDGSLQPEPAATKSFLEKSRAEALRCLILAWQSSERWNDLRLLARVSIAGEVWPNDPVQTRTAILDWIQQIPVGKWWSLNGLIQEVRERNPDFIRKHGEFDSWYIHDRISGSMLDGIENWDSVEGELIRSLISGVLFWMGIADLGGPQKGAVPAAFRLTPTVRLLGDPDAPLEIKMQKEAGMATMDGVIKVPRSQALAQRYQISRFAEWVERTPEHYTYLLTVSSLDRAKQQGIKLDHLKTMLGHVAQGKVLEHLVSVVGGWYQHGVEARVEHATILRFDRPEILEQLQAVPACARYLGEQLSPTTLLINAKKLENLRSSAFKAGILLDTPKAK